MALNLWPVPHGLEDLLNPIGVTGSNPNKVFKFSILPSKVKQKKIFFYLFFCTVHALFNMGAVPEMGLKEVTGL